MIRIVPLKDHSGCATKGARTPEQGRAVLVQESQRHTPPVSLLTLCAGGLRQATMRGFILGNLQMLVRTSPAPPTGEFTGTLPAGRPGSPGERSNGLT